MAINAELVGTVCGPSESTCKHRDTILYALGTPHSSWSVYFRVHRTGYRAGNLQ